MKTKDLWLPLMNLLERNSIISLPQAARLLGATQEEVFDALEELVFSYDACGEGLILEQNFASLTYGGSGKAMKLSAAEEAALKDCLHGAGGSAESARILRDVALACDDPARRVLEIEYQGEKDATARTRSIKPLALRRENGYLYLRAWCLDAKGERDFRLDRIKSARVDQDTDPLPLQETSTEAAPREDDTLAVLELAEERLVEALPQARVTKRNEDGSCEVKLPWHNSPWLPKHIAASGGAVRPLAPEALREAVCDYINSLLRATG